MIIASIDIMNGKSVQLINGKEKVIERDNVFGLAKDFDKYGEVALIDLDAAMGKGDNKDLIHKLLRECDARVGGGIRTPEDAVEYISYGARKIIVGTMAFKDGKINHDFLSELVKRIGKTAIIIAVDSYDNRIAVNGWKNVTDMNLFDAVAETEKYCSEFLYTDINNEGTMKGIDTDTVRKLKDATTNKITVAGGVSTLEEIEMLASLGVDVQLGMALYTGGISLSDAFVKSLNWRGEKLIPVVTQDRAGRVLMHAYCSRESLKRTFETGRMTYFSRSRNELWTKGETSGNFQNVIKLRADCDRDTVLSVVEPEGVSCHLGTYTCFGDMDFKWHDLYDVITDRIKNPSESSYTAKLDRELLREKILEEAKEVVEAEERWHVIWELADVIYFLTVLMARNNVTIEDVMAELYRRRKDADYRTRRPA